MTADLSTARSRRALLSAAAGAAGALAAGALIPAGVAAADPNDVVMGQDNPTTATTSITDSMADSTAFAGAATGAGAGFGVQGTAAGAAGVYGWSVAAPNWSPNAFTPSITQYTGVFGSAPAGDHVNFWGSGVWGDSPDTGVFGSGAIGVEGYGFYGVAGTGNQVAGSVGVQGNANNVVGGIGVRGNAYAIAGSVGVRGNANSASGTIGVQGNAPVAGTTGVLASASTTAATALSVSGKAHFSRSGRTLMAAGRSSLALKLAGVTTGSKVFAVLSTSASGRYVRAVVPATGVFTIYLNTTLAAKAYVTWFVLD